MPYFDAVLEARDEMDFLPRQLQAPVVVRVAAIEHQHGVGRERHALRRRDIRRLAIRHHGVARQIAVVIENHEAQRDHGRVQRQQLVLNAKLRFSTFACKQWGWRASYVRVKMSGMKYGYARWRRNSPRSNAPAVPASSKDGLVRRLCLSRHTASARYNRRTIPS